MNKERYLTKAATMVFLCKIINDEEHVLLQLRQNTGYADNMWDASASGHLEANESIKTAAIRESFEEIGVDIAATNLKFISIDHKRVDSEIEAYFNFHFLCTDFKGTPKINEPQKCKELKWFPLNNLPENIIIDRKLALQNYKENIYYSELNW